MPLTLFAMPVSQPARAVHWALEHSGTAYIYENIMPGKVRAPVPLYPCIPPQSSLSVCSFVLCPVLVRLLVRSSLTTYPPLTPSTRSSAWVGYEDERIRCEGELSK